MENQNKPETLYYDLGKAGVLLLLILIFTFSLERSGDINPPAIAAGTPGGTSSPAETPEVRPSETQPVPLTPGTPGLAPPVFTADGKVVLSGTGVAGTTIVVQANGQTIGEVPVSEGGIWVFRASPAPGDYQVVVLMQDSSGQVLAESPPLAITVPPPGVVPEPAVTATPEPEGGEGQAGATPPAIEKATVSDSGEATVTGTGQPGSTVVIYENGVPVATAEVGEDGTFSATYPSTPGDHTFEVRPEGEGPGQQPPPAEPTVAPTAVPPTELPPQPTQPPQPTATPTLQPIPPGGLAYVVQPGEWLIDIARKFYGDPTRWVDIYVATNNRAIRDPSFALLVDPNFVQAGWKIFIPE